MLETNVLISMNVHKCLDRTESVVSLLSVRTQSEVSAVGVLLEVMASLSLDVLSKHFVMQIPVVLEMLFVRIISVSVRPLSSVNCVNVSQIIVHFFRRLIIGLQHSDPCDQLFCGEHAKCQLDSSGNPLCACADGYIGKSNSLPGCVGNYQIILKIFISLKNIINNGLQTSTSV